MPVTKGGALINALALIVAFIMTVIRSSLIAMPVIKSIVTVMRNIMRSMPVLISMPILISAFCWRTCEAPNDAHDNEKRGAVTRNFVIQASWFNNKIIRDKANNQAPVA
jgi:hypothetical protein